MSDRDPLPARTFYDLRQRRLKLLDDIGITRRVRRNVARCRVTMLMRAPAEADRGAILTISSRNRHPGLDGSAAMSAAGALRQLDEARIWCQGQPRPAAPLAMTLARAAAAVQGRLGRHLSIRPAIAERSPAQRRAVFSIVRLYRRLANGAADRSRRESDLLTSDPPTMVDAAADAELVVVPGLGHAPELTEPEATAAIDRFLRRLAPAEHRRQEPTS